MESRTSIEKRLDAVRLLYENGDPEHSQEESTLDDETRLELESFREIKRLLDRRSARRPDPHVIEEILAGLPSGAASRSSALARKDRPSLPRSTSQMRRFLGMGVLTALVLVVFSIANRPIDLPLEAPAEIASNAPEPMTSALQKVQDPEAANLQDEKPALDASYPPSDEQRYNASSKTIAAVAQEGIRGSPGVDMEWNDAADLVLVYQRVEMLRDRGLEPGWEEPLISVDMLPVGARTSGGDYGIQPAVQE